jgi:hypothetical protein
LATPLGPSPRPTKRCATANPVGYAQKVQDGRAAFQQAHQAAATSTPPSTTPTTAPPTTAAAGG